MKYLILGNGAREHALAWKLAQDPASELWCAPGNAGIEELAVCLPLALSDHAGILAAVKEHNIDLVVVGPEAPLVAGLVDDLDHEGINVFGPLQAAAQLEGSKVFSKRFMARHGIPTAGFEVFESALDAQAFVREANRPLVVKADGIAAGKGVFVCETAEEACAAIDTIMTQRAFGEAGAEVIVEERLLGVELSYHIVAVKERFMPLATSQDHKRLEDGDKGPNTGGMGAYSPAAMVDDALIEGIHEEIVRPTLAGLSIEGRTFRGVLFIGIMLVDGVPYVLEYNTRFGDPETAVLMARWGGDLSEVLLSAASDGERLHPNNVQWTAPCAVAVVLASEGYPSSPVVGVPIVGIEEARQVPGVQVFHAGTARNDGVLVTAGGRVLTVTGVGDSFAEAKSRAYQAADCIDFPGKQLRRDIGHVWESQHAQESSEHPAFAAT